MCGGPDELHFHPPLLWLRTKGLEVLTDNENHSHYFDKLEAKSIHVFTDTKEEP